MLKKLRVYLLGTEYANSYLLATYFKFLYLNNEEQPTFRIGEQGFTEKEKILERRQNECSGELGSLRGLGSNFLEQRAYWYTVRGMFSPNQAASGSLGSSSTVKLRLSPQPSTKSWAYSTTQTWVMHTLCSELPMGSRKSLLSPLLLFSGIICSNKPLELFIMSQNLLCRAPDDTAVNTQFTLRKH